MTATTMDLARSAGAAVGAGVPPRSVAVLGRRGCAPCRSRVLRLTSGREVRSWVSFPRVEAARWGVGHGRVGAICAGDWPGDVAGGIESVDVDGVLPPWEGDAADGPTTFRAELAGCDEECDPEIGVAEAVELERLRYSIERRRQVTRLGGGTRGGGNI